MKTALLVLSFAVSYTNANSVSYHHSKQSKGPPQAAATCNNVDWNCGEAITICGGGGSYGNCICAGDIAGHTQCIIDSSCDNLVRCSDGGECNNNMVCLSGENCCGVPNCVPLCTANATTTTMMPTTTTEGPSMCAGIKWQCGGSVTICGNQGPYDECFCGNDVDGNSQCFTDEACNTQTQCSTNSDCPSGNACVPGTCCDVSLCLPICGNSTKTTTPSPNTPSPLTPSPTSSSICNSAEWTCGGSVTICGSQGPLGECFCNEDINQNHYCMIDNYCSEVPACTQNSDCQSGSICAPSCCGTGNCFQICNGNDFIDPVEFLLPITAFHTPSHQEKQCAESYVRCREKCSAKFGRCTAKHGKCPQESVQCLEQCKHTREKCDN